MSDDETKPQMEEVSVACRRVGRRGRGGRRGREAGGEGGRRSRRGRLELRDLSKGSGQLREFIKNTLTLGLEWAGGRPRPREGASLDLPPTSRAASAPS